MADDKSQKTEQATPKRKREAKRKGQIAKTPDLVTWGQVLAATYLVTAVIGIAGTQFQSLTTGIDKAMANPDIGSALALFGEAALAGLWILAPLLIAWPSSGSWAASCRSASRRRSAGSSPSSTG